MSMQVSVETHHHIVPGDEMVLGCSETSPSPLLGSRQTQQSLWVIEGNSLSWLDTQLWKGNEILGAGKGEGQW